MEYVDLSHKIKDRMPVYHGDADVTVKFVKVRTEVGFNCTLISTGMHAGTHVDSPLHFLDGTPTVDKYAIENFTGSGRLIDARGSDIIGPEFLARADISQGDIVLIMTGHSRLFGTMAYFDSNPIVTEAAADFLIGKGVKMLGIDAPSPDAPPFAVHKKLLGAGIFLLENLTGLERLIGVKAFEVFAVPLKYDGEASMVRAFARISSNRPEV